MPSKQAYFPVPELLGASIGAARAPKRQKLRGAGRGAIAGFGTSVGAGLGTAAGAGLGALGGLTAGLPAAGMLTEPNGQISENAINLLGVLTAGGALSGGLLGAGVGGVLGFKGGRGVANAVLPWQTDNELAATKGDLDQHKQEVLARLSEYHARRQPGAKKAASCIGNNTTFIDGFLAQCVQAQLTDDELLDMVVKSAEFHPAVKAEWDGFFKEAVGFMPNPMDWIKKIVGNPAARAEATEGLRTAASKAGPMFNRAVGGVKSMFGSGAAAAAPSVAPAAASAVASAAKPLLGQTARQMIGGGGLGAVAGGVGDYAAGERDPKNLMAATGAGGLVGMTGGALHAGSGSANKAIRWPAKALTNPVTTTGAVALGAGLTGRSRGADDVINVMKQPGMQDSMAQQYVAQNPDKVNSLIAKQLGIDEPTLALVQSKMQAIPPEQRSATVKGLLNGGGNPMMGGLKKLWDGFTALPQHQQLMIGGGLGLGLGGLLSGQGRWAVPAGAALAAGGYYAPQIQQYMQQAPEKYRQLVQPQIDRVTRPLGPINPVDAPAAQTPYQPQPDSAVAWAKGQPQGQTVVG